MPDKDTYARKNVIRYGIYQVAFLLMSLGNCISTLFDMNSTGCSKHVEMWMRKDEPTTGARWNEINWRVSCASVSQKTLLQTKQCCESCNGTCS
jgi:hypothetical protein